MGNFLLGMFVGSLVTGIMAAWGTKRFWNGLLQARREGLDIIGTAVNLEAK